MREAIVAAVQEESGLTVEGLKAKVSRSLGATDGDHFSEVSEAVDMALVDGAIVEKNGQVTLPGPEGEEGSEPPADVTAPAEPTPVAES